ncbi:MAG: glycerol-3-phosphate dehydrogenase/oxidase [Candidatus Krumholzibacteria bacterium]
MIRDSERLREKFDLLVIGGGIYGAWTAYDAALRGLRVAIIDKGDWGSGTSSASSKLIHGGLRYLEQFRFGLVRRSLAERRRLFELAPHRVRPLRFLMPVYRNGRVGPLRLKLGLTLYDKLAGNRQPVGPHTAMSRDEIIERFPFLEREALRSGFTYGDCQMDDHRFVLEIIAGAVSSGAVAVNYAEADELLTSAGRVAGARVRDCQTNDTFEVRASLVVNTAGPWAAALRVDSTPAPEIRLIKGVHLVLPALPTHHALLVMTRGGRVFFVLPWYGRTLLGTTDSDFTGDPDQVSVEESDVTYLLDEVNRVLGSTSWSPSDVLGGFAGTRALRKRHGGPAHLVSREWSLQQPARGYLVSIGGKFTSARADAACIVDRVAGALNKPGRCRTASEPFPWSPGSAGVRQYDVWKQVALSEGTRAGLDPETAGTAVERFGTSITNLLSRIEADAALAGRLVPEAPFCKAEIVHAAEHEMAFHLDDLLRRRLPLLILTRLERRTLEEAAALAAPVLHWSPERCRLEVDAVAKKWNLS